MAISQLLNVFLNAGQRACALEWACGPPLPVPRRRNEAVMPPLAPRGPGDPLALMCHVARGVLKRKCVFEDLYLA